MAGFYDIGHDKAYTLDNSALTPFMLPGSTQTVVWDTKPRGIRCSLRRSGGLSSDSRKTSSIRDQRSGSAVGSLTGEAAAAL